MVTLLGWAAVETLNPTDAVPALIVTILALAIGAGDGAGAWVSRAVRPPAVAALSAAEALSWTWDVDAGVVTWSDGRAHRFAPASGVTISLEETGAAAAARGQIYPPTSMPTSTRCAPAARTTTAPGRSRTGYCSRTRGRAGGSIGAAPSRGEWTAARFACAAAVSTSIPTDARTERSSKARCATAPSSR